MFFKKQPTPENVLKTAGIEPLKAFVAQNYNTTWQKYSQDKKNLEKLRLIAQALSEFQDDNHLKDKKWMEYLKSNEEFNLSARSIYAILFQALDVSKILKNEKTLQDFGKISSNLMRL